MDKFKVGDKVLIKYPDCLILFKGRPGTGTIINIHESQFQIHYDVQIDGYDRYYFNEKFLSPFEQPTDIFKSILK